MKYGRRPAHSPAVRPRVRLGPALRPAELPVVPNAVVDELSAVGEWPMYLNDEIGDCTVAAAGHMIEAWTAYGRGTAVKISDGDVLEAYRAVSGYVPGDPSTDTGAVMQDVLDFWRKTGIGGHRILAFAEVDIRRAAQVEAALYLFGHVYLGLVVPASAEDQFAAGQPWDLVRNDGGILGGHAVNLGGWDASMPGHVRLEVVTWGRRQQMTSAFWRQYVQEAWVVADQEWVNATGGSPPGLDAAALNAQYTALTGQPGPFPTNPVPPGPADPDQVLAAVARPWVNRHHTTIAGNRRMAAALKAWLTAKSL